MKIGKVLGALKTDRSLSEGLEEWKLVFSKEIACNEAVRELARLICDGLVSRERKLLGYYILSKYKEFGSVPGDYDKMLRDLSSSSALLDEERGLLLKLLSRQKTAPTDATSLDDLRPSEIIDGGLLAVGDGASMPVKIPPSPWPSVEAIPPVLASPIPHDKSEEAVVETFRQCHAATIIADSDPGLDDDARATLLELAKRAEEMHSIDAWGDELSDWGDCTGDAMQLCAPGSNVKKETSGSGQKKGGEGAAGTKGKQPVVSGLQPLKPLFFRPLPSMLPITMQEVKWLHADETAASFLWDSSEEHEGKGSALAALKKDMKTSSMRPLAPKQQRQIIDDIKARPAYVHRVNIAPVNLKDIVEHNPPIAVEFLLNILGSSQMEDFLNALSELDITLHSMEVVNGLATSGSQSIREFLHVYIIKCISSCNTIQDKYQQSRVVRLVCVFLQSLIRNNSIDVSSMFVEMQAFCVEFSRIKEAANLFQQLKAMEEA